MKYEITISTPGDHLSTDTFSTLFAVLRKDIENGVIDAIQMEFGDISKTLIRENLEGKISFTIEDMRKGSWIIEVAGSLALVLGTVAYLVCQRKGKRFHNYEDFQKWFKSHFEKNVAEKSADRINDRRRFGGFEIEKLEAKVIVEKDQEPTLVSNIELLLTPRKIAGISEKEQDDILRNMVESNLLINKNNKTK